MVKGEREQQDSGEGNGDIGVLRNGGRYTLEVLSQAVYWSQMHLHWLA